MRAGYAPASVAKVGVCEELEGSTAGDALKVVFNLVRWPSGAEEILQRAGALGDAHFAVIDSGEEPVGQF